MRTNFDTLRLMAVYLVNHLKEKSLIDFAIEKRTDLIEALATELGVSFSTDEDIREQAIEDVEEKFGTDNLPEDITETEMFNAARKEIVKSFNGESLAGMYMVESLYHVAVRVKDFLMKHDLIDDVFGTDEELITFIVKVSRSFNPKNL